MNGRRSGKTNTQGDDITYQVTLTFMEAALGCTKEINFSRLEKCPSCGGSGAKKCQ
jgi:DnaJ-class molecular chaperone with C-terminal Zn finger domain